MKQYRITSETFNLPGNDPSVPDNYVNPKDLADLKKLAGIDPLGIMEKTTTSSLIGVAKTDNGEYQRKNNISPGTDAWFRLWFARTPLTGEDPTPNNKV